MLDLIAAPDSVVGTWIVSLQKTSAQWRSHVKTCVSVAISDVDEIVETMNLKEISRLLFGLCVRIGYHVDKLAVDSATALRIVSNRFRETADNAGVLPQNPKKRRKKARNTSADEQIEEETPEPLEQALDNLQTSLPSSDEVSIPQLDSKDGPTSEIEHAFGESHLSAILDRSGFQFDIYQRDSTPYDDLPTDIADVHLDMSADLENMAEHEDPVDVEFSRSDVPIDHIDSDDSPGNDQLPTPEATPRKVRKTGPKRDDETEVSPDTIIRRFDEYGAVMFQTRASKKLMLNLSSLFTGVKQSRMIFRSDGSGRQAESEYADDEIPNYNEQYQVDERLYRDSREEHDTDLWGDGEHLGYPEDSFDSQPLYSNPIENVYRGSLDYEDSGDDRKMERRNSMVPQTLERTIASIVSDKGGSIMFPELEGNLSRQGSSRAELFYELLSMSTKATIKLQQGQPYEPIQISMLSGDL